MPRHSSALIGARNKFAWAGAVLPKGSPCRLELPIPPNGYSSHLLRQADIYQYAARTKHEKESLFSKNNSSTIQKIPCRLLEHRTASSNQKRTQSKLDVLFKGPVHDYIHIRVSFHLFLSFLLIPQFSWDQILLLFLLLLLPAVRFPPSSALPKWRSSARLEARERERPATMMMPISNGVEDIRTCLGLDVV